ncbi:MAG TPA: acyl-CoA dehydrogenase [Streptosporangiaceae bacterium]|nr:acyl-CoA dehydrogenase [Streptosporangiaceae bacterium]
METVKIPSRTELVQRVADIAPVLRANALWGEQNRRLADEVVDAMIGAGVLRMLVPTQYGGYESDMQTVVDVGIQLGRADGSPAFCATAWWAQCWAVAHFPDPVQDEIFGDSPDVRICGTLVPNGKGEITKDGVLVSGEWGFNSGAWHSQWKVFSTLALNPAGEIEPIACVVPMSDLEIVDDWDVAGLRGTGSITLVARDVFVPRERFQWMSQVARQEYDSERNADSPCYRGPIIGVLSNINTGKQVGLAQAAREAFLERIHRRTIQHTNYATQAEWPVTHLQVAEADLKIDEAEYHARRLAALVDHKNFSNEPYTMRERAYCRVAVGRVSQLCCDAANIYNMAGGAGGIYNSMPIQRIQRDLQAISLHAVNMPVKNYELYGRVLCGLEPNTFFI